MERNPAEIMDTTINHELETKPTSFYLGSLEDLGLGNPDGIPSALAEADDNERKEYGEKLLEALAPVTDFNHYGCIDGRNCITNADGSAPEVRRRQVGGTGLLIEVGMNGDAPIMDTISPENDLTTILELVEDDYTNKTGVLPSAHLGGCGGVNGAISDNKSMAVDATSVNVAKAVMEHPAVRAYSGLSYDETLGQKVREEAPKSAEFLEAKGWDGQKYVDRTKAIEPAGVEDLEVNPDDKFNGHKEQAVVFVLSTDGSQSISEAKLNELGLGEVFPVNVDASVDMAKAMAGNRKEEGATQALIANLAKHAEVAKRLPSTKTPVYLLVA
jgi:hypothetical protein